MANYLIKNHHLYRKCEECGKLKRHMGHSWGKWLCRNCLRKNILGEPKDKKFKFEYTIIKKKLNYPFLTRDDFRFLFLRYEKQGLTKKEQFTRLRCFKARLSRAHKQFIEAQQAEAQPILTDNLLKGGLT